MDKFLSSNTTRYRLARTILQGIIGVLIANIDVVFASLDFSTELKTLIVGLTMAVLSPIMGALSDNDEKDTDEPVPFVDDDTDDTEEEI